MEEGSGGGEWRRMEGEEGEKGGVRVREKKGGRMKRER